MPCQPEVLAVPPFLFDPVPYRGDSAVPFGRFRFDRRHPATTTATAALPSPNGGSRAMDIQDSPFRQALQTAFPPVPP